jgi:hypothetical protein
MVRLEERDRYLVILPKQKGLGCRAEPRKKSKTREKERISISVVDGMIVWGSMGIGGTPLRST